MDDIFDKSGTYHDNERFAMFSQLARLAAAEDIIVRWNVPGMSAPAQMSPAGRVLDVAPVKKKHENKIPGLIFHEIAHFVESEKRSTIKDGKRIFEIDPKLKKLLDKVKNHFLWNIIEDGYVERKAVVRWPGTLKYFRVLYEGDREDYQLTGDKVVDTMNTLFINCSGIKWGEKLDYPPGLSSSLLTLLEKARTTTGDEEERAQLAIDIHAEFLKMVPPKAQRKPPIQTPMIDISPVSFETPPAPPSEAAVNRAVDDFIREKEVSSLSVIQEKEPEDVKHLATDPLPTEDVPAIEDAEIPPAQSVVGDEEESDDGYLLEFISDNAAKILGSNQFYMQNIVEADTTSGTDRFIATYDEMMLCSVVLDIFHPSVKEKLTGVSFNKFITKLQDQSIVSEQDAKEAKKFTTIFFNKTEQAKVIAKSMFQQFTTKANASNIAQTRFKRTGNLDPTRAAMFSIYDDIFKKRKMEPQKINHGYVLMVDWSASMNSSVMELFHRVAELTYFARLANVELDIWLYTTNDRAVSRDSLSIIEDKLRDNLFLVGSKFIKVLNTRECSPEEIQYRLFSFFCACSESKTPGRSYKSLRSFVTEHNIDFISLYNYILSGTNIFEALVFGNQRASKLDSQRKGLILMTDGQDQSSWTVTYKRKIGRPLDLIADSHIDVDSTFTTISRIFLGRVDLFEYAKVAQANLMAISNKYGSDNPFKGTRTTASFLIAEEARKNGISVIGVTWGSLISTSLSTITRRNVVRVQLPKNLSLTAYEPVKNTFITSITEALLSNIRK